MVSGHLQVKKGFYYAVINYLDAVGKRHTKWLSTGLPEKGNKRKAQAFLTEAQNNCVIPKEMGDLSTDMLFADYLEEWVEIVKMRVKLSTYASYCGMIKSTIAPYFRTKKIKLKELEARHL